MLHYCANALQDLSQHFIVKSCRCHIMSQPRSAAADQSSVIASAFMALVSFSD